VLGVRRRDPSETTENGTVKCEHQQ